MSSLWINGLETPDCHLRAQGLILAASASIFEKLFLLLSDIFLKKWKENITGHLEQNYKSKCILKKLRENSAKKIISRLSNVVVRLRDPKPHIFGSQPTTKLSLAKRLRSWEIEYVF